MQDCVHSSNADAEGGANTNGRSGDNPVELVGPHRPLPDRPDQIESSIDNRYESINATPGRELTSVHIQASNLTRVTNNRDNLDGSGEEAERHLQFGVCYQSHSNVQGSLNYEGGGHSIQYNVIPHQVSTVGNVVSTVATDSYNANSGDVTNTNNLSFQPDSLPSFNQIENTAISVAQPTDSQNRL